MNAGEGVSLPPHLVNELAIHLRNSGSTLTVLQAATDAIGAWMAARSSRAPTAAQPPDAPHPAPQANRHVRAPLCATGKPGDSDSPAPSAQGYQWKTLFLPSGTELRMSTREATHHARVEGDDIIFHGRRVSPRGMTLAIAGDGRNAWRDLWLRLPGQSAFWPASRQRREHDRVAAGLPANPAAQHYASLLASRAATGALPSSADTAASASTPTAKAANVQQHHPAPTETVTMSEVLKTMLALMQRLSERSAPDEERRFNRTRRAEDILVGDCAFD